MWRSGVTTDPSATPESPNTRWCTAECERLASTPSVAGEDTGSKQKVCCILYMLHRGKILPPVISVVCYLQEVPLTECLQQLVAQGILSLEKAREMMPEEAQEAQEAQEDSESPPPSQDPVDPALQAFHDRWLSALDRTMQCVSTRSTGADASGE